MSRGNGRMRIFEDDRDYRQFVHLLGEACEEHHVECWGYCAMPNHYHAVLRPTLENISLVIQQLNGEYAMWWNRRHGRVGHTFQGRFKDQIVAREGYIQALLRYVALNPVRATLVGRAEDWQWSSFAATIGVMPPPSFLDTASALEPFGPGDQEERRARFATFVCAPVEAALEDRIRSSERILGDASFKKAVRGQGRPHGAPPTAPGIAEPAYRTGLEVI